MGGDRGEVDDGPSTAPQRGKGGAREANGAHQHQVDSFRPRLVVQLGDGAEDGPAGVVDQHVEAAQGRGGPRHEVATLVSLPEIGDPGHDVVAVVTQRFSGGLDAVLVARGDRDPASLRGQRPGRSES